MRTRSPRWPAYTFHVEAFGRVELAVRDGVEDLGRLDANGV
jgi:hypothetical protein